MIKSITLRFFSFLTLFGILLCSSARAEGYLPDDKTNRLVDRVIEEAMKYIGTPYRWGGKTPAGFDCAGFTRYIFSKFGLSLAPSAGPQFKQGTSVKKNELCRGDLVFFGGRRSTRSIGHVGIVTSVKDDEFLFIHAASKGITVSSSKEAYYSKRYICACRVSDRIVMEGDAYDDPAIVKQVIVSTVDAQRSPENRKNGENSVFVAGNDTASTTLISIAMVGDMMLGTTYPANHLPENNGENLFDEVRSILRGADVAVGNCEGVISEKGNCTRSGKNSLAFRMPTSYAYLFRDAGFDFLSLANNHSNDFGSEAIRETMSMLDSMRIGYAGIKNFCRTATLNRDGITYGFCAFGYNGCTFRHQDVEQAKSILKGLRDSCDILIVSFHGGAEGKDHTHLPQGREVYFGEDRGDLRSFAHMCVNEGADVVFGHGPYVCRAVECYKGHFIAYSLGSFCTPTGVNLSGISGYAPVVVVNIDREGKLVNGRIHSFIQPSGVGPRKDETNKVAQFIRSLTQSDFKNAHIDIGDDGSFVPAF